MPIQDPYARKPPAAAPLPPAPAQPGPSAVQSPQGMSAGDMQVLFRQMFPAGPPPQPIPPPPMMGGNGVPNAGAMQGAQNVPPPPMPEYGAPQEPPFPPPPPAFPGQGNPSLMADPMAQMLASGPAFMGGQEAPPPVNLSVPGGASISNGNPQAAMAPPKIPDFKPTYNVTMATDPEAARMQHLTEVQRGQNQQAKRSYEEMNRARKVNLMRGMLGN